MIRAMYRQILNELKSGEISYSSFQDLLAAAREHGYESDAYEIQKGFQEFSKLGEEFNQSKEKL
jgi:uncharacterized FlgJ-related protein